MGGSRPRNDAGFAKQIKPRFVPSNANHDRSPAMLWNAVVRHVDDAGKETVLGQSIVKVIDHPPAPSPLVHLKGQYRPDVLRDYDSRAEPYRCGNDLEDQSVEFFLAQRLTSASPASTGIRRTHPLTRRRGYQEIELPIGAVTIHCRNLVVRRAHVTRQPSRVREVPRPYGGAARVTLHLHHQSETGCRIAQVAQPGAGEERYRSQPGVNRQSLRLLDERAYLLDTHDVNSSASARTVSDSRSRRLTECSGTRTTCQPSCTSSWATRTSRA